LAFTFSIGPMAAGGAEYPVRGSNAIGAFKLTFLLAD